jgi:hypothetical protein
METPEETAASIEYRCVLVWPNPHELLVVAHSDQFRLPRIPIPPRARPARELQKAIKATWKLDILVFETWCVPHGAGACAVAEVITPERISAFAEIPIEQLMSSELSEEEFHRIELLFEGKMKSFFSRLGWLDEAMAWIESATGHKVSPKRDIAQWNAGRGFVLLRVGSDDGRHYWLKATGEPNAHEFAITRLLSESYPDFLPRLIATRAEWNAWLTEDAGGPITDPPSATESVSAAMRMASLQILTVDQTAQLLAAGGFDQRLPVLRGNIDPIISYLIEAMAGQTSTKAAPLSRDRLLELAEILRDACLRLEALGIPATVIHNDLNPGNILTNGTECVFTDWSEAAVGNPFIACERLCRLNPGHQERVRAAYRDCWADRLTAESIEEAIALTPLIAVYAYLYGRGDWPRQKERIQPGFESYARSLARHMDRAANESSLAEVLCH